MSSLKSTNWYSLESADLNKDNFLSFEEAFPSTSFETVSLVLEPAEENKLTEEEKAEIARMEAVTKTFNKADLDNNNYIDLAEARKYFDKTVGFRGMSKEQVQ
jgi:hypothetical protein